MRCEKVVGESKSQLYTEQLQDLEKRADQLKKVTTKRGTGKK
jgi:hypothetical protein